MSKKSKIQCTECNALNGMHVEDVEDIKNREGAARVGNDFRPPVSSKPVLVLNANYISRFLTYLTPPKT